MVGVRVKMVCVCHFGSAMPFCCAIAVPHDRHKVVMTTALLSAGSGGQASVADGPCTRCKQIPVVRSVVLFKP